MKHEEECFITYPNTEKCVEKTRRNGVRSPLVLSYELLMSFRLCMNECWIDR